MNCCCNISIDPDVDKLLSNARLVLVASQGVSSMVPIPGIGAVTSSLISLIDKIAVCVFTFSLCVGGSSLWRLMLVAFRTGRRRGRITRASTLYRARSRS